MLIAVAITKTRHGESSQIVMVMGKGDCVVLSKPGMKLGETKRFSENVSVLSVP
jgi:hypothetical protein